MGRKAGRRQFGECGDCSDPVSVFDDLTSVKSGDGVSTYCRKCHSYRAYLSAIKRRYGLDPGRYLEMIEEQGGCCAICRSEAVDGGLGRWRRIRLAVDHDHKTGAVRGLLCGKCNLGIGHFMEDETRLLNAIRYIKENNGSIT
jgi:hypothetical protein